MKTIMHTLAVRLPSRSWNLKGSGPEETQGLRQLSPFIPPGKFATHDTMDVSYTVEPAKEWKRMTRYNRFILNVSNIPAKSLSLPQTNLRLIVSRRINTERFQTASTRQWTRLHGFWRYEPATSNMSMSAFVGCTGRTISPNIPRIATNIPSAGKAIMVDSSWLRQITVWLPSKLHILGVSGPANVTQMVEDDGGQKRTSIGDKRLT
ncbi:hypothetical protein PoMZ_08970 [Pyricularia oryzae]|uniref:Uncharacterized protein n=2 Tax=Pyricularia oryzae TaxID=318829 RepID=A0A4V1C4L4_PYROR|nr:hypothetical protein PoMZ_08970 [Pyricularia oryzae]